MAFRESVARLGVTTPYDAQLYEEARGDWGRVALFKGVIASESSWNPAAVNPNDPSYGLMQLTLPTAQQFSPGVQPATLTGSPEVNIAIGTAFLRDLLRRYAEPDAIAYYNAGCPTPKVAGLSGCPLRNSSSQYTNSQGSTAVQAYVDSVLTYQVYYLNAMSGVIAPTSEPPWYPTTPDYSSVWGSPPEPVAAGDGWGLTVGEADGWLDPAWTDLLPDLSTLDLESIDLPTIGVLGAVLVGGALLASRWR